VKLPIEDDSILDGHASVPAEYKFAAAYESAHARALARVLHGEA
jgi:hypothetical protein